MSYYWNGYYIEVFEMPEPERADLVESLIGFSARDPIPINLYIEKCPTGYDGVSF